MCPSAHFSPYVAHIMINLYATLDKSAIGHYVGIEALIRFLLDFQRFHILILVIITAKLSSHALNIIVRSMMYCMKNWLFTEWMIIFLAACK